MKLSVKHSTALIAAAFLALSVVAVQVHAAFVQKIITFSSEMTRQERRAIVEKLGGTIVTEFEIIDAVTAVFPETRAPAAGKFTQKTAPAPGIEEIEDDVCLRWINPFSYETERSSIPSHAEISPPEDLSPDVIPESMAGIAAVVNFLKSEQPLYNNGGLTGFRQAAP